MKTHLAVHNIKQRDGESTKAFVTQLKTRSLVEFLSTDLPTTYKGLMEKTYTWIDEKEIATNEAPNDYREGFDKFGKGPSWDNNIGRKKDKDIFYSYNGSNRGLLTNLSKSPRQILATEKAAKGFDQSPRMLRHQIKEVIRLGQLAHLVKGIKQGKANNSDTQLGE
ncbi:hypothetical protein Tco_0345013 [Tanacetum coccineum]